MSSNYEDFKRGNAAFAEAFAKTDDGKKPLPPARRALLVTCMDARIHPEKALGVDVGDIHVVRNAGGRAQEALRSVAISQQLLATKEVYVLHHTDCGMLTIQNSDIHSIIKDNLGADASHIDFLPFGDLEQSVRDDVELIQASKLVVPGTPVRGGIYHVETGKVTWLD